MLRIDVFRLTRFGCFAAISIFRVLLDAEPVFSRKMPANLHQAAENHLNIVFVHASLLHPNPLRLPLTIQPVADSLIDLLGLAIDDARVSNQFLPVSNNDSRREHHV